MAIRPGTSKALVETLGKANTRALAYSTAETTAFDQARKQGTDFFFRNPDARQASQASAIFGQTPNAPMSGAGARSAEASAPLAG